MHNEKGSQNEEREAQRFSLRKKLGEASKLQEAKDLRDTRLKTSMSPSSP